MALAVYALSWITLLQFDIPYDENVLYFIFFASITGYNFVKYFGLAKFHHRSLAKRLKTIQVFSGICFVIMCYFALKLELKTLLYIGVFGIATFLYAIPIIPKKIFLDKQKNLRSIGGLKVYIIAIVWAGVTVFLPLLNNQFEISDDVIITAFQCFVFVLVLMLPFEIRDLNYDNLKLATIPQKIGVKQTKLVGSLLLLIFFVLNFFKDDIDTTVIVSSLIISSMTLLFLVFARQNQNKYYSAFWVESLPLIWLGILLLVR
nr:hypothetical protein [uncultured Psychroserpens sp.]